MESPLPSTSRMVTRSRAQELPKEIVSAINTSIPCFCGNQKLLKFHSTNCKQQMYNWVSTGDPYTYTEDDWAHKSEPIIPVYNNPNDEDFGLPNLFDETGYRGSSDIDPEEQPEEPTGENEEEHLPNLEELGDLTLDETPPPGPPLHQSTPESSGTRPKLRQGDNIQNRFPGTDDYYPPISPHNLYQARLQNIHRDYQDQYIKTTLEGERQLLRQQLYHQLQEAETSFKLLLKNPEMMTMTPKQLKFALSKTTSAPKQEKKGLFAKMRTPKTNTDSPLTRFQLKKQQEDKEKHDSYK